MIAQRINVKTPIKRRMIQTVFLEKEGKQTRSWFPVGQYRPGDIIDEWKVVEVGYPFIETYISPGKIGKVAKLKESTTSVDTNITPMRTICGRPDKYADANLRFAAEKLVDAMTEDGSLEGDLNGAVDELAAVLDDNRQGDGYQLAKALERRHYWQPSTSLVEHLDMAWCYVDDAHRSAVKAWTDDNGIKPDMKVGDPDDKGASPVPAAEPLSSNRDVQT